MVLTELAKIILSMSYASEMESVSHSVTVTKYKDKPACLKITTPLNVEISFFFNQS